MSAELKTLEHFGVSLERLTRQPELLRGSLPHLAGAFVGLVAEAPDPMMALANWERLTDESANLAKLEAWTIDDWAALFRLLGSSQSLSNTLLGEEADWPITFRRCLVAERIEAAAHRESLAPLASAPWEVFAESIRRYRHREYLRIGLADLTGRYPVAVTVAELSSLAAGLCDAAYVWARASLCKEFGELVSPAGDAIRFVVLGMGKLGGGELNFSSDVDLVYLYESDEGQSVGGPRGVLEPRAYCARLAELITRALQEVTSAGFAFRVDLRLRPDGMNGPIANSLSNTLLYYEAYGQTWERTALLQARPVAGSIDFGELFLREVRPFVYRRFLDFSTVADMKAMKAQVESRLSGKAGRGHVKLGRGGIREIEFLAQVLQLIHGGRDDRVRTRGSLVSLERLVACRYLPAEEGAMLADAYCFLRNVEHKIQIVHQRQTHSVPSDRRDQETLARRLGYRGEDVVSQFWSDLDRFNEVVRRAFEKLFDEPAAETRRASDEVTEQLVRSLDDREACLDLLAGVGFSRLEQSYGNLRLLRDGSPSAPARPRQRELLYELAPALLTAIRRSPDPDLALENLATFISSVGARTSFLTLLRENPGTLRMMVELFGSSQFLANAFIRRPELLDSLVRADLVRVHRTLAELLAELDDVVDAADDFEGVLDALRRFRNQEFLRVGINDLQALLGPEEVVAELAIVAEACVRAACKIAARELCERLHLDALPGQFVIIAMGKLGGGELNYNSDLDLIFVYRDSGDESTRFVAHEQFTKLLQRMITVLQVTTKEGIVYKIDTRLRPSGRSGPLVSSLDGFRRYHEESAQVWERQALIKARPIAGDMDLAREVEEVIASFVYRAPLSVEEAREIRRLRGRMERELAKESREHVNIKIGRGGLVDVEFVTQMLQLRFGCGQPRIRSRNTLEALAGLAAVGVLPEADSRILSDGYRFIRRVENSLRLSHDRPVEDLDRNDIDVAVVARRLGFSGGTAEAGEAFWTEYASRREAIRACYERWFERAELDFAPSEAS